MFICLKTFIKMFNTNNCTLCAVLQRVDDEPTVKHQWLLFSQYWDQSEHPVSPQTLVSCSHEISAQFMDRASSLSANTSVVFPRNLGTVHGQSIQSLRKH